MDDDLGVSLLPAPPVGYSLPTVARRDELDLEAATAVSTAATAAAPAANDDDEFDYGDDAATGVTEASVPSSAAPRVLPAAAGYRAQPSSAAADIIGASVAADALAAVRASLVAAQAAEVARAEAAVALQAQQEAAALEARVMGSMLLPQAGAAADAPRSAQSVASGVRGGGSGKDAASPLSAVGEEDEDEEDEDESASREPSPLRAPRAAASPASASAVAAQRDAAVAQRGAAAASPAAGGGGADADTDAVAASLAAEFDGATAAVLAAASAAASSAGGGSRGGGAAAPPTPASLAESLAAATAALLDAQSLAPYFSGIVPSAADPGVGCIGRLFAPRLAAPLEAPRDAVFALAKRPYDGLCGAQAGLMGALYGALTGDAASSAPGGATWTAVGFQRESDFTTDLRGVGMLGPLLVLAATVRHRGVVDALWAASASALHPFPFMVQCLSLTAKSLHALRLGKLTRTIQAAAAAAPAALLGGNPALEALGEWCCGLMLDFATAWRSDPLASLARLGHIQVGVIARAYARPDAVLARLQAWEAEQRVVAAAAEQRLQA